MYIVVEGVEPTHRRLTGVQFYDVYFTRASNLQFSKSLEMSLAK